MGTRIAPDVGSSDAFDRKARSLVTVDDVIADSTDTADTAMLRSTDRTSNSNSEDDTVSPSDSDDVIKGRQPSSDTDDVPPETSRRLRTESERSEEEVSLSAALDSSGDFQPLISQHNCATDVTALYDDDTSAGTVPYKDAMKYACNTSSTTPATSSDSVCYADECSARIIDVIAIFIVAYDVINFYWASHLFSSL